MSGTRRLARRSLAASAVLAVLACAPSARAQHLGDMFIGSTVMGGGALALEFDFGPPVIVSKSFEGAGQVLYVNTNPGWDHPPPTGPLFALGTGTPVIVALTAADAGASIKIGAAVLDVPGESASLGNAGPGAPHVHPVWQLVLPSGVLAERAVSFEVRTSSAAYARSATYTLRLTNTTSTTSTSSTSTTSSTASTSTSSTSPVSTTTSSTLPFVDQPLAGEKLLLRDDPQKPAKRQAMVLSKDVAVALGAPGSAGDPTLAGAWLVLTDTHGAVLNQALPAAGWELLGKPTSPKGYRYEDKNGLFGPVTGVLLKAQKSVKITAKGETLVLTLADDPRPVAVELGLGTRRYCLAFGGTAKLTPGTKLLAKESAPPAGCPMP